MAYDEAVAQRLRDLVAHIDGVTEKKMFGGLAFLINGNMAVAAASKGGVMLRIDPERADELVDGVIVERMEMKGRQMSGWLLLDSTQVPDDEELAVRIEPALSYSMALPPK